MTKRQLIKLLEVMRNEAINKVNNEKEKAINDAIKDCAIEKNTQGDIKQVKDLLTKAVMILNLTHAKIGLKDRNWGSTATAKIKHVLENMNDPSDYIKSNMNIDPLTLPVITMYETKKDEVKKAYGILIQNVNTFPKITDAIKYVNDMGFNIQEVEKAENLPILPLNTNLLIYKGE